MAKLKDGIHVSAEPGPTPDPLEEPPPAADVDAAPAPLHRPEFAGPQRRLPPSNSTHRTIQRSPTPAAVATARGAPLPTLLSQQHLEPHLHPLSNFEGFIAAVLVERYLGQPVCMLNPNKLELEPIASIAARSLNLHLDLLHLHAAEDNLQDILVTSGQRFLLFRPLQHQPSLFLLLVLERERANLGMARIRLAEVEARLGV